MIDLKNTTMLKHKVKRFLQRIALKIIKVSNKGDLTKSDYQYECLAICKNLMHKEKTKLLTSPISGKRYINSDDKQIYIIIDNRQITIVNHNYSYTIELTYNAFERLSKVFDNEVELRRQEMEKEIRSNVKHSLKNIYNNIVNDKV